MQFLLENIFRLQNNAFLNDSFIESSINGEHKTDERNPNDVNRKSVSFFTTSTGLPAISEKGESSAERSGKSDSISRQLNFDHEEINKKKEPDRPRINLFSKLQSNDTHSKKANESTSTRSSDSAWKTKSAEVSNVDSISAPVGALTITKTNSTSIKSSDSMLIESKLCPELQTPIAKTNDNDVRQQSINMVPKPSSIDDETPYKTFQMPQTSTMRRAQTSSQHRTLLSSANQSKKCRTDLENEFRSQKVLFTTPSAVSRPAMKVMNHLGLDDSLNCYKSSPMVNNLSPVKEERNKENKCPTSITGAAKDLTQATAKIDEKFNGADENDAKAPSVANENDGKKEKIITINNKDFIVQNKIGHGGSSSVFLVEHKETKLQCALKVRF